MSLPKIRSEFRVTNLIDRNFSRKWMKFRSFKPQVA